MLEDYAVVSETNPHIFWEKYENNQEELKKREKYIAQEPEYSYYYARDVLKGPFSLGEATIATDAKYAYWYALYILEGPFPAGEEAISKDAYFARWYAHRILKVDFYLDDKLIAKAE